MIARTIVLACIAVVSAATFVNGETPKTNSSPATGTKQEPRSPAAIQADVRAALIAEAKSRRTGNNTPDVLRLVKLYHELASHPKRDKSVTINELGQQVRSRLVTVRDRVKRRIADSKKDNRDNGAPASDGAPTAHVLAQQVPPNAGAVQQGVGQGSAVTGIPRATGLPTDLGPELVELIEATISPSTWNINGGPGAIVYYGPLHVLVVAAPQDVHEQIGNVLGQLNAAQREIDGTQVVSGVNAVQDNEQQFQNP